MTQFLVAVRWLEGKRIVDSSIELDFDEEQVAAIVALVAEEEGLAPDLQGIAAISPFISRAHANDCKIYNIVTDLSLEEVEEFLFTTPQEITKEWILEI